MFFCFQYCFQKRFWETTGNNAAGKYVSHVCDGKQALFSIGVFQIAVANVLVMLPVRIVQFDGKVTF